MEGDGSMYSGGSLPNSPVAIDPAYEFSAPRYFDFSNFDEEDDPNADTWFSREAASCKDSPWLLQEKRRKELKEKVESVVAKASYAPAPAPAPTPQREGPVTRALARKHAAAAAAASSISAGEAGRGTVASTVKEKNGAASSVKKRVGMQGGASGGQGCVGGTGDGTRTTKKRPAVKSFAFSGTTSTRAMVFKAMASSPKARSSRGIKKSKNRTATRAARSAAIAEQKREGKVAAEDGTEEGVVTQKQYSNFGWTAEGTHNYAASTMTIPKSPKFATNRRAKQRHVKTKSSEEETLEKAKSHQLQAQKRRKLDAGRLREKLLPRPVLPVRSTVALTIPYEIHLHTEERLRSKCQGIEGGAASSSKGDGEEYVPLAEAVLRFQRKTPDRFHTRPHNEDHPTILSEAREPPSITQPREPVLETAHRSRPVKVKSSAEIEEELMANIQKFKARPFARSIVERGGDLGVPVVPRPPPTEPQEFSFATAQRAALHCEAASLMEERSSKANARPVTREQSKSKSLGLTVPMEPHLETMARARPSNLKTTEEMELEEVSNAPKFKARPVGKHVLHGCGDVGLPVVPKKPTTIPEEFDLATERRARLHPSCSAVSCASGRSTIRSDDSYELAGGGAARAKLGPAEPFHLETEERGAKKKAELQKRLQEEQKREEEMRVPKAQPLRDFVDVGNAVIPKKPPVKEPTLPEPFNLQSAILHETAVQKWERMLAEQQREEMERANFKAQPVLKECPVMPVQRPRKPLTTIQEPNLSVERRAIERQKFNSMVEAKQRDAKRSRDEYEAQVKEEELRVIQELRRTEMIPKARPIPAYPPPAQPAKSTKELTRPVSPQFTRKAPGTRCMR
ncbi:hypothetical protein CBR_g55011 [Chara braunii]|uniref:TPX2 C-terminal domain-containing protein n=1 Tax=Chara braunii TaxID=69332 RepID=A0A388K7W7_CHABU|nr:hypothetical protein CBR_g55011 [Chara braunii]|eukprot:GBG66033.1 hypothetical protein CBR_g55011 [Chara braunii]